MPFFAHYHPRPDENGHTPYGSGEVHLRETNGNASVLHFFATVTHKLVGFPFFCRSGVTVALLLLVNHCQTHRYYGLER